MDVAVGVIRQGTRVLITQRKPGDSFGGFWEFPGGKPADGERLEETLSREMREELGIEVAVGSKRMTVTHPYPDRVIRLAVFECAIRSGRPRAIECAQWRWVLPEALGAYRFPPASEPILKWLRKRA